MKKAFLVTITVTTRVVVDAEDIDNEEILEAAQPRLRDAVAQEDINCFLDDVREDEQCPYNPENDD